MPSDNAHGGGGDGVARRGGSHGPDPFFWAYLAACVIAVVAAVTAPTRRPGFALDSAGVYRAEIGLIFLFVAYLISLGGFLAYQGRSIGTIKLADVLQTDFPDPAEQTQLADAKDAVVAFDREVIERQDALEAGLEDLLDRVEDIEETLRSGVQSERNP